MADPSTSLKLLVAAIKSRSPVSFQYNKAGKMPGLRLGNPHAAFILRRKDGTESTKVDIVQTSGLVIQIRQLFRSGEGLIWLQFPRSSFEKKKDRSE